MVAAQNDDTVTAMLHAASLTALAGIRHAFFTRDGGVSDGVYASLNAGIGSDDVPARVVENRSRMAAALGVRPDCLITAYQVHSPEVVTADRAWVSSQRPRADAIVTRTPGLAIGITTADCGPVLFADATAGVIGATHAGWRGAMTGVLEATILGMEACGARRARIAAALGPMIRQANYEVGPEFVARFQDEDAANARFFKPSQREGHALFDLPGYIAARLAAAGIGHVEDVGHCTYADPGRFFSYRRSTHRREKDYGRHLNAIALENRSGPRDRPWT
jgi:polyphenol oxidase